MTQTHLKASRTFLLPSFITLVQGIVFYLLAKPNLFPDAYAGISANAGT